MGNIVLLDDLTINKIAAGEVIERPASVVKEMVENSIDAGASNIVVEIKNGGISYIRITDNGKGIMPDDMEIAFERHATSKIRVAEDLEDVKSMGFRGEALASVAAISKISMKSKTIDNETGYEIVVEGGKILTKDEVGCPKGTTITVENLFFNTPVRYKFLKKDFTEAGYIEDAMTRIALIHPEIAIKLISSGKTIIQTSGNGDLKSVVYGIYGKEIAENLLDVNYEYEDIKVSGVVGKPIISRSNRANQMFFVNERYVKDKTLNSSAEQAFKGMITIGKFGFLILNIELNPRKVDVNVHPAKLEVRFEEEQKVFKAVYHSIKDTLLKNDLISNPENTDEQTEEEEIKTETEEEKTGLFQKILSKKEEQEETEPTIVEQLYEMRKKTIPTGEEHEFNINSIMGKMAEMKKSVEEFRQGSGQNIDTNNIKTENEDNNKISDKLEYNKISDKLEYNTIYGQANEIEKIQNEDTKLVNYTENKQLYPEEKFEDMYTSVFGNSPKVETRIEELKEEYEIPETQISTGENISVFEDDGDYAIPKYKYVGIAFSTYIIMELNKELYILDQHAAHERIMYEKIKENYYREDTKDSQLMLLPDIIRLTNKEMDIARDNMEMFKKAGFDLEEFGENTIRLTGVPNICLDLDTKELFLETLDEINTVARTAKQEIEEKFIATVACKAAVKANMALTREEVDSLMEKLLKLPNPFTCPHGRPTAIKMTKTDIEKKFSRR